MLAQGKYTYFLKSHQGQNNFRSALIILFLPSFVLFAAGENNGRGTKAIGMANAFVAIADRSWAPYYNSAGLAQIHSVELSGFLVPNQFGLKELRTISFACTVPVSLATLGLCADQFGFDLYREFGIRIGVGLTADKIFLIGCSTDYHRLSIDHYGVSNSITLNISLLAFLTNDFHLGCNIENITGASISQQHEKLPQTISTGISYFPLQTLVCSIEIEKDVRYPSVVKAGLEQRLFGVLAFDFGISNNPDKFSMGFSISTTWCEFGYAGYSHAQLGWTDQIEISIRP